MRKTCREVLCFVLSWLATHHLVWIWASRFEFERNHQSFYPRVRIRMIVRTVQYTYSTGRRVLCLVFGSFDCLSPNERQTTAVPAQKCKKCSASRRFAFCLQNACSFLELQLPIANKSWGAELVLSWMIRTLLNLHLGSPRIPKHWLSLNPRQDGFLPWWHQLVS